MSGFVMRCVVVALQVCFTACCPDICRCFQRTVDCYNKGFFFIPEDVEEDTHTALLAYNRLSAVTALSFYNYQSLEHLELQNNRISDIHSKAFQYLQNLTYLDLSSNQLTTIKMDLFRPLSGLTTLNLGNNKLTRLSSVWLQPLVHLQTLYLHNNVLTGLNVELLDNLASLSYLRLDGNPWACTCHIQSLHQWLMNNTQKVQERDRIRCGAPSYLDQYVLVNIKWDSFQRCHTFLTLSEYLYLLLIGSVLFGGSIILCILMGSLVVSYEWWMDRKSKMPRRYKKRSLNNRVEILVNQHLPVCKI